MAGFVADLAAGEVVHLWLKPVSSGGSAAVTITCGASRSLLAASATDAPLRTEHRVEAAGETLFAWDEATTAVSLAYAYDAATVFEAGVRILWVTGANRANPARHRFHLSPPWGWMNDPNGLCTTGGLTHAFYQHHPHSHRWDTMHWGHAVSRNLVDWVHLPVFLLPREELSREHARVGGAFSGSAVAGADGALSLFFTDHEDGREPDMEEQRRATSADGLAPGPAHTVLAHRPAELGRRKDWRDPYVFRGPDGRWKMVIGAADDGGAVVLLYEADELDGDWRYCGILFREPLRRPVSAECPTVIALDGDGLGEGLHVLVFGMIGGRDEATRRRNLSHAVVGRFDGRTFEPLARRELDDGTDCYAFQAFDGPEGPTGIAWAANWTDVFRDRDFHSALTLPRRLLWRDGRLLTPPVAAVETLRTDRLADALPADGRIALPAGLADVEVVTEPGAPFRLDFDHPEVGLALAYDGTTLELLHEPPGHRIVPRYLAEAPGLSRLRVIVDVGLVEIFGDDGRWCLTKRIDSDEPVRAVRIEAGPGAVQAVSAWALRPAGGREKSPD